MEIKENLFNEILLSQINAFCVRLNLSYSITEIIGEIENLGFQNFCKNSNIFKSLPKPVSESLLEVLQKNLRTNDTETVEVVYADINNVQKKVKITSNLIDDIDEIYFFVSFVSQSILCKETHKINNGYESFEEARRKLEFSESRYNSYFENDPVMHLSVNPITGFIADCNMFVIKKLEYSSKSEIIGKPIYAIFSKKKKPRCLALVEKFKKEGYLDSEEMELQTSTGKEVPVILHTSAQRDENGKILLSRSTLVDISELKNTQKRLKQQRKRLENLNLELEQFVSTCSHDLQEPLGTIKFANDLLDKLYSEKLDDKAKSYINYIDEAVDRLSSQIRSLLSHIQIGQNAKRNKVDTHKLVKTVLQDLGKSIVKSNAKVEIKNPLPTIKAYEVELRLLFQNLISNAIKYSKEGITPCVEVTSTSDGLYTYFSIKDNGIGISKLDQNEIFKIFSRVNQNPLQKGDGVGLTHCEKIVRMHEGEISIESELGKGSIFTVKLKQDYIL